MIGHEVSVGGAAAAATRWLAVVVLAGSAGGVPAAAWDGPWRLVAGAFQQRWLTAGAHGHRQDCRTRACDEEDFRRSNLDNAQGVRVALDRPWRRGRRLTLSLGGELGLQRSEYNRSQHQLQVGEALAVAGVASNGDRLRLLIRGGLGVAASDDGHGGPGMFAEAGAELCLGEGAALRLAARRARRSRLDSEELVLSLVGVPAAAAGVSRWELEWSAGATWPGRAVGGDLGLTTAPLWQLVVHRRIGRWPGRLGVGVAATDHESGRRSTMEGVSGNQRGKAIWELVLTVDRELTRAHGWRLRLGGGVRVASFEDEYHLLIDDDGAAIDGGGEAALLVSAAAERDGGRAPSLVVAVDQLYWTGLGLGELRLRAGVVVRP